MFENMSIDIDASSQTFNHGILNACQHIGRYKSNFFYQFSLYIFNCDIHDQINLGVGVAVNCTREEIWTNDSSVDDTSPNHDRVGSKIIYLANPSRVFLRPISEQYQKQTIIFIIWCHSSEEIRILFCMSLLPINLAVETCTCSEQFLVRP